MPVAETKRICDSCHLTWSITEKFQQESMFRHHLRHHVNKSNSYRVAYLHRHKGNDIKRQCDDCLKVITIGRHFFEHYVRAHSHLVGSDRNRCVKQIRKMPRKKKQCDVCLKNMCPETFYGHFLRNHWQISADADVYCDVCARGFSNRGEIAEHFYHSHIAPKHKTDKLAIQCDDCLCEFQNDARNKRFATTHLFRHFLTKHTLSAPTFMCDACDNECQNLSNLRRHVVTVRHLPQSEASRPTCDICAKEYATKTSVISHQQDKHAATLVGYYDCDCCQFSSTERRTFQNHVLQHCDVNGVRYECDVCGQLFKNRPSCHGHTRREHEKVVYVCDCCGRKFSYKRGLMNVVHCGKFVC